MAESVDRVEADRRGGAFAHVLRHRAFAVLFAAETLSIAGDQLARVALAVLVFARTGNAAATALTYATSFVPAIVGGFVLGGIGDHISRRAVMVACNVVRTALFAAMALPGLPIWSLLVMLVGAVFLEPAFAASEVSYLADALDAEQYRAATGLRMITNQAAQVLGFAIGGVLVAALHPRGALLVDAATFAVSAALIRGLLAVQRVPGRAAADAVSGGRRWRTLWSSGQIRFLLPLSALAGFFVVPEGLAVPFGHHVGASTPATGVLLAAIPLGGAVGAFVLVRVIPAGRRMPVAVVMAIACGVPLVASAFAPPWPVAFAFWFLSGAFAAYQVEINSAVVRQIPAQIRSAGVGVASALLTGAQGLGLVLFGIVAEWLDSGVSIAVAGVAGTTLAILLTWRALAHRARQSPVGVHRRATARL